MNASSTIIILILSIITIVRSCETAQDTCIAFDESSRMGFYEYMEMVQQVVNQISDISKQSPTSSFSAIGYTTTSRTLVHPTKLTSQFARGVNSISLELGKTSHSVALKACYEQLMSSESKTKAKTIVVISNGKDIDTKQSKKLAMDYKLNKNIAIISIAVDGDDVNKNILKAIANDNTWAYKILKGFHYFTIRTNVIYKALCQANQFHNDDDASTMLTTPTPIDNENDMMFDSSKSTIENGNTLVTLFLKYSEEFFSTNNFPLGINMFVVTGVRKRGLQDIGDSGKCLKGKRTSCGIRLTITAASFIRFISIVKTIRKIIYVRNNFNQVFQRDGIVVKRKARFSYTVEILFSSTYLKAIL